MSFGAILVMPFKMIMGTKEQCPQNALCGVRFEREKRENHRLRRSEGIVI